MSTLEVLDPSGAVGGTGLAGLLPAGAVLRECHGDRADPGPGDLPPEEAVAIADAVPGRRREFATTRACAREALAFLGIQGAVLPRGPRGAPVWPRGVVGSLTHCAGYRAAAVAPAHLVTALGIDAEPDLPLPEGVLRLVASASEIEHLGALPPGPSWDRLLFSAKESVYKAWYPVMGCWLGFEDVEVRLGSSTFSARLLGKPFGRGGPAALQDPCRRGSAAGLVLTASTVRSQP